jgi:histidyl-tRNA synthetase
MKFVKNTKYYTGTVYEWNLPTGHTCPFALECLVKVDRQTGKFENKSNAYRCYAASPERFPAVRNHRWTNYEYVLAGNKPELPKGCTAVRIHAAGDFFNQAYFDMWVEIAKENPDVEFWAYTKSLKYWVNRINEIPANLVLTASAGGRNDELIDQYKLKHVQVVKDETLAPAQLVDTNDNLARIPELNFYLIDNFKK